MPLDLIVPMEPITLPSRTIIPGMVAMNPMAQFAHWIQQLLTPLQIQLQIQWLCRMITLNPAVSALIFTVIILQIASFSILLSMLILCEAHR